MTVARFYARVQALKSDVTRDLDASPPDLTSASKSLVTLKTEFRANLPELPAYDQRSYELQIRELETRIANSRPKSTKPKFAFTKTRSRAEAVPETQADAVPTAPSAALESDLPGTLTSAEAGPSRPHLSGEWITSHDSGDTTSSPILSDLVDCVVDLRHPASDVANGAAAVPISSLHARRLTRCVVLADVGGSVLLQEITDSILVLSCHQFRMHDSRSTTVLLSIPSHPIIEHSGDITFSAHPSLTSSAEGGNSKHGDVHDFGWLKEGPSPHWRLLSDDDARRRKVVDAIEQIGRMREQGVPASDVVSGLIRIVAVQRKAELGV